ncbi:MAG: hypothetical protein ACP6IU_15080 [Candidatus Asgardarchaeia archaeon]
MFKTETQFDLFQRIFELMKKEGKKAISIYDLIEYMDIEADGLKLLLDRIYRLAAIGLIALSFEDGNEGKETIIRITPLGEVYLKENT